MVGVVGANPNKPTPPMGNGHLSKNDFSKTCYMWRMKVIDGKGESVDFDPSRILRNKQDATKDCYDLEFERKVFQKPIGASMTFGGPGGMCP
ncbi:protein of unknown function DUF239 [Macleaya cordata]|uniref:Neprosin PEP catalytic domain-containing protein n=1 Tax=Macleaya cordata TaxID=56857 RepID=A0A200QY81_MACCD|nr:protein of unknown function DUF239 [Macleaya cordata]